MAREELKILKLNKYEEGAIITALNNLRTEQLAKNQSADLVSELLLKVIRAPNRKGRAGDEAR